MPNEEVIKRIAVVSPFWAETMREHPTRFEWQPIPFYSRFQLLVATVSLEFEDREFHYADDGSRLCVLRSSPEDVYEVNELEDLHLDAGQIPAYIRFFFDNLMSPRLVIVDRSEEVPWFEPDLSDPDLRDLREQASSMIQPMRVTPDGDEFRVTATALAGADLKAVELRAKRGGRIDLQEERVLVEDLPVMEELS